MKKTFIAMMVIASMITGANAQSKDTPAIDLKNMDQSINPADDFFRYCRYCVSISHCCNRK